MNSKTTQTEQKGGCLFQPTLYQSQATGKWHEKIQDAIDQQPELTWDTGGFLATLSNGYPFGDTTLFREIKRQPWLSNLNPDGSIEELPIPPHQLYGGSPEAIGRRLFELMCEEAETACQNRDKVYILLSGGLDSRVIAGVVHHLLKTGRIRSEIEAVTWGIKDCRDVYFGQCVAERLGYKWTHAPLSREFYFQNIELAADALAAAISPSHLHRMNWFANIDPNSLVLAGSLGNMIGRGQITTRSMLEVLPLRTFNYFNLMARDAFEEGTHICNDELQKLRSRAGAGLQPYIYHEHEQAAHFSRGMLCQTMNIISHYCDVYQMLSAESVFSFMWSRHPAVRTDHVYAEVLELVGSEIAAVPWSRTNKSVKGSFAGETKHLSKKHNDYRLWTHLYLNSDRFDQERFLSNITKIGFVNTDRLEDVVSKYAADSDAFAIEANQLPLAVGWLVSLAQVIEKTSQIKPAPSNQAASGPTPKNGTSKSLRRLLANNAWIRNTVAKYRRSVVTKKFTQAHPIQTDPNLNENDQS